MPRKNVTHTGDSWSLLHGDCLDEMSGLAAANPQGLADLVFADPPYFLSNGGMTCSSGKMVSVNKGNWDRSAGVQQNHEFNLAWLALAQRLLKPNGTIWVSGTHHVIYSVGFAMQQLGFRIINDIIWEKPNPPPNLGCRCFTHSTEILLWASRTHKSKHYFDYQSMKTENGGKQMKSVWRFKAPGSAEKKHGRHPTQKPVDLLKRVVQASSREGDLVLDPFCGSGSTGVAAVALGRRFLGIEESGEYCELSSKRIKEVCK